MVEEQKVQKNFKLKLHLYITSSVGTQNHVQIESTMLPFSPLDDPGATRYLFVAARLQVQQGRASEEPRVHHRRAR